MLSLLTDLRRTARALLRVPAFSAGIVVTLALGLGLNAVMVTLLDRLLLQAPAGVVDPATLTRIYLQQQPGTPDMRASTAMRYPIYTDLLQHPGGFAELAAVARRGKIYGEGAARRRMEIEGVSGSYFGMLGVRPALGRLLGPLDDQPDSPPAIVLGWDFWQRELGGAAAVLGRPLTIEGRSYTVVGIAPRGFGGLDLEPAEAFVAIVPGAMLGDLVRPAALTARNTTWMTIVGRLKPGVTPAQAADAATPVLREGMRGSPRWDSTTTILAGPIQEFRRPVMSSGIRQSVWISVAALAVLLIACVNITNLLLARGMTRERELAIRASLGAGRRGLVRVLLTESLLLSAAGGALAILFAIWFGGTLRTLIFPWLPDGSILSLRFFAMLGAGIAATAFLTGVVPAVQLSRLDTVGGLRRSAGSASPGRQRLRSALLVAQTALTLLLLVGAGLFIRSLQRALRIDTGMDPRDVYEVSPRLAGPGLEDAAEQLAYLTTLMERLRNDPSIVAAGMTQSAPFSTARRATGLRVDGRTDTLAAEERPFVQAVTPGYLATVGTTVLHGRGIANSDDAVGEPVAVVNATMARTLWPSQDALGKCLFRDGGTTCTRVVGVAADTKTMSLTEEARPIFFVPLAREPVDQVDGLYLRTRPGAGDPIAMVRAVVEAMPLRPYTEVYSLQERIDGQRESWLHAASLFSIFSLLGLLLAAVGTFSVLSYGIAQRTREIGVRMALGARQSQVIRMVVYQGVGATGAGIVLGAAAAGYLGRGIASLLYQTPPADPLVYGLTGGILLTVALGAAWLPARRAARIDPMTALRGD